MKKFRIYWTDYLYGTAVIEAEDEYKAKEIFYKKIEDGSYDPLKEYHDDEILADSDVIEE